MKFTFSSRTQTLTVILTPSKRTVIGNQVIAEPGLKARFEHGMFETEDPETADLLREKIRVSGDRTVIEITGDIEAFPGPAIPLNQRGPATALDLKSDKLKMDEKPATFTCPICEDSKKFKTQAEFNLHLVSHRSTVQKPKVEEPQPAK